MGVTAAVPDPRFRDQLEATAHQSIQQASWARGVAMLDSDVAAFRQRLLEDLMPLVEARVQAAANQRAAEAWNEAASIGGYYSQQHGPVVPLWVLRARAAALASPAPAPHAEEG